MKVNQWTLGLAAVGLVSLPGVMQAEEASQHLLTALSSTTISGFVDTSAQWNLGTGNANNPAIPYNGASKADGFNVNYIQLTIQKPLEAQDNWAAGYRVDLGFGDDLRNFGSAINNDNDGTGINKHTASNVGLKQAYVNLRAPVGNGLEFKVGAFDTIIGYETFERINNPHYTHSYGNGIEPTSHTGILASYQLTELIGVSGGIANTRSPGINTRSNPAKAESYKTFLGSITLKAPDSFGFLAGSMLYAGIINGADNSDAAPQVAKQNYYVGATINSPWTGIKFGIAYDYVGNGSTATIAATHGDAVAIYSSIKATDKLTFLVRGEHFEQSVPGGVGVGGSPSRVLALTGTAQYDLWANVISRLEIRWDHQADGTGRLYGDDGTGAPDKRNALLVAANLIYKF